MDILKFNNVVVSVRMPQPKINQIWKTKYGLVKVVHVSKEKEAWFEDEKGDRHGVGLGWLNGIDYIYIGVV